MLQLRSEKENDMKKMKRLLAAILVTSMLFGSNGISYAAEAAGAGSTAIEAEAAQETAAENQGEDSEVSADLTAEAEAVPASEESDAQVTDEQAQADTSDAEAVEAADEDSGKDAEAAADTGEAAEEASDAEATEAASAEETAEEAPAESAPDAATEQAADAAPAAATEQAADAASTAATEQEAEEVFQAGELFYEGVGYNVTLAYDENAKIPADAKLKVREITKGTAEYEAYMKGAQSATDKGVAEARFFDITIWAGGQEVQPQSPVRVNITYSTAIEVADEGEVQAMHFESKTADPEVLTTDTNGGSEVSEIAFDAESFSVYGVVYTVDFTYGGFTFSMPGEGSILLSELAEKLNLYEKDFDKAFSVQNVDNVTFTDNALIKLEKQADGDWLLTSLASFTSEETLTIIMNDGVKFIVDVTDAQSSSNLVDFLTGVTISAPTNAQGAYVVEPGTEYAINMSFSERDNPMQLDNVSMTYPIPDGIDADGHSGTFQVKISRGGQTYTVAGNTYSIENGVLTLTWNQNDPNYSQLTASGNVTFSFSFDGKFDENADKIKFSDKIEKDIDVDTSNSVTTSKSAQVDVANDKIYYTATVTSDGTSKNVVITDTISGTGVTLDPNSIQATSSTGQAVSMTGDASGNSFTYTIPQMKNGEIITFKYAADIDPSVLQLVDGKVVSQSGNTFKATSDGDPEGDKTPVTNTIDYTPKITKSSGTVTGTDGTKQTLTWTLTVNPETKVSAAGTKVTDTIGASSQSIMKYSGDGITVKVTDASGNTVRTDNVEWGSLSSKTDSTWTYVIPTSDAGHPYKYEISYTTEAETKDLKKLTNVDNTGTTDGGGSSTGTGQVGPIGGGVELKKEAGNVDKINKEVTWNVTFVVPGTGLDKAIVTDTYPHQWVGNVHVFEKVKEGTVTVTGLTDGEDWSIVYGDQTAVITFTKDGAAGLKGTGSARTISVTLKTEISDVWLEAAKAESWRVAHQNTATLDYGEVLTSQASVNIAPNQVQKSSTAETTRTVDGVELPVYKYEVVLFGVESDNFTITDVFDTEILEPYNGGDDAFYVYGGTQYYQGNKGSSPVTYINSATGMTMNVSIDSLPKDGQNYYTGYKVVYYLTVKDQTALNKLIARAAAAEDGKATLENRVDWEGETDTTPVVYTYEGLDKEILTSDEELKKTDEDIYADFRITLNPGAQRLNGGEPLTMTDTVNNLSVVLTSIQATPSEGVSWDMSGNTVTYTIPDATKVVITYKARVIFTTIGETGDTVKVEFSNEAEMEGYSDKVNKTAERHNSGGGVGSVPSINLLKYEAGNMTKRLSGAKFALLDSNKNPVVDKNGNEVTFTTGADGMIKVEGDQEADGWSIAEDRRYYLRETEAPEGYKLASFDYSFQISSDGTTDYSKYIYHSGDTMSAKNYPGTDVSVSKIWSDGNDKRSDNDYVEVKLYRDTSVLEFTYADRNLIKEILESRPHIPNKEERKEQTREEIKKSKGKVKRNLKYKR